MLQIFLSESVGDRVQAIYTRMATWTASNPADHILSDAFQLMVRPLVLVRSAVCCRVPLLVR